MSTTVTTTATETTFSLPARGPAIHRGPTEAQLSFFTPPADGARPYTYIDGPKDIPEHNYEIIPHRVPINDMRGSESTFNLNTHAFQPIPAPPGPAPQDADFSSDEAIARTYYPEVEHLLLSRLSGNPSRVVIFDHTVRRAVPGASRGPVQRVHIDQTPASARARVHRHVRADEAERILSVTKERVRLVNVWRPLNGAVESWPLAVADSQSVPDSALKDVELRFPDRIGETSGVEHDEGMRWWYLSGMTNEERLLLQCFDSETGTRVPHTAFEDERAGPDAKPRESIEVRALIFG